MIYCKIVREFWRVYVYGCLLFKQLPEPSFCHGCSGADSYPPKISYILTLLYNQRLTSKKSLTITLTITFFLTILVKPRFCCRNPCEFVCSAVVVAVLTIRYRCVPTLHTLANPTFLQRGHSDTEYIFSYNVNLTHITSKEKRGASRPVCEHGNYTLHSSGSGLDFLNQGDDLHEHVALRA